MGQCRPRPVPSADARHPQVVRGTTALVMPDLEALLKRLRLREEISRGHQVQLQAKRATSWRPLARGATASACMHRTRRSSGRCARHAVRRVRRAGRHQTGKIAQFYIEILGGIAGVSKDERGPYAWASTSGDSKVIYRETKQEAARVRRSPHPDHACRLLWAAQEAGGARADHRGERPAPVPLPRHRRCGYQQAAVPASSTRRAACVTRCSTGRIVNRNPDMNNRNFVPGYEVGIWALA